MIAGESVNAELRLKSKQNSYKTAIKRSSLSRPMRYLLKSELLNHTDDVLDYGCGRGDDAKALALERYDPHYYPELPSKKYEVITCMYVLNVINDKEERNQVLQSIKDLLTPNGVAYIAVRRDGFTEGFTRCGSWQGDITLDLQVLKEQKGSFCIYQLNN